MKDQWIIKTNCEVKGLDKAISMYTKSIKTDELKTLSTCGNKSKQYNIFDFIRNNEDFYYIYDVVLSAVREVLTGKNINLLNAWTVLGQEKGYHVVHSHDPNNTIQDQKIATVLYLNTTPKSEWQLINEEEAGNFKEIIVPCGRNKFMYVKYVESEGFKKNIDQRTFDSYPYLRAWLKITKRQDLWTEFKMS